MLPNTRARDSLHFTHSEAIRSMFSSSRRALCTEHISELLKNLAPYSLAFGTSQCAAQSNDRSASHDVTRHTNIRRTSVSTWPNRRFVASPISHIFFFGRQRWTVVHRTHCVVCRAQLYSQSAAGCTRSSGSH